MEGRMDNEGGNPQLAVISVEEEGQLRLPPEEEVFGNDMLRDIIVDHAIHQENGSLDRSTVRYLRSVGKDWNDSVCKLLHKNAEPLFEITLGQQNHVPLAVTTTDLLGQFTQTFASSPRTLGRSPTFELTLGTEAFHQQNYESLHNFLLCCGQGIVKLELLIPGNGGSMKGRFPNLALPSLRKAAISLNTIRKEGHPTHKDNVVNLLQSMFRGANALKELEMSNLFDLPYHSSVIKSVVLPPSLEQMVLLKGVSSSILETMLLKKHLPNLTSLYLQTCEGSMAAGLLPKILDKVRGTLKNLSLYGGRVDADQRNTTLFRFPGMEKLETFETFSQRCQLDPEIRSLERFLPKLRLVKLSNQTFEMLRRLTQWSRYPSVEELILDCSDGILSLDQDCMSLINLAFPKVTKLELAFDEKTDAACIRIMFTKMTSLVNLKMIVLGPASKQVAVDWDSLLVGIEPHSAAGLRAIPELWENIQLNNDGDPSIRKLKGLRSLSLQDGTYGQFTVPFITDVSFHFALLKMPLLRKLCFSKSFFVSSEMTDKWTESGRFLKYTEFD